MQGGAGAAAEQARAGLASVAAMRQSIFGAGQALGAL